MASFEQIQTAPVSLGQSPPALMHGPPAMPILGWHVEAMRWSRDQIGYMTMLYRKYGVLSTWGASPPLRVFAFAPEHNQRLLSSPDLFHSQVARATRLPADSAVVNLRSGLLNLNGPQHKQHRQLMSPAFHRKQVENYRNDMVALTQKALASWSVGAVQDMEQEMRRLVHSIAMKTVLNLEHPEDVDALTKLIARLFSSVPFAMLFPFDAPGTGYRRLLRTSEEISAFLQAMIDEKRSQPVAHQDILAMLIAARNEDGTAMTDAELIAEGYNVLCHEGSASALTWTLFLLAQHPDVQADVLDELAGELAGDPPTNEQLGRLPLLERVIKESMRLLPPVPFGRRFAVEPCQFGRYELRKGTPVFFSHYITHRMPEIYEQPQRFLPKRWERLKPTQYEYLPFGAGTHNCVGGAFAMMEMKIVLAMLIQRFRLSTVPDTRIDRCFRFSLKPLHGLPMRILDQDRQFAWSPVRGNICEMVELPARIQN
ncbi:MAG TPA: cytochrome P450 [Pyrinomonadaceae bacterium]|jgi:cytochrome P450|nr:cytochrome P450 [Pyrinomonadaceae bacterium]